MISSDVFKQSIPKSLKNINNKRRKFKKEETNLNTILCAVEIH